MKLKKMRVIPVCLTAMMMFTCFSCASAAGDKAGADSAVKTADKAAAATKADDTAAATAKTVTKDNKAASVNGKIISRSALDSEFKRMSQRFMQQGKEIGADKQDEFRKEILDNLINRELLYQEAEKKGIKADEEKIEARFAEVKKSAPTEADFQKMLTEMGVSEADIKTEIRRSFVIQEFIDSQITAGITVPDEEIKAFYDGHPDYFKKPEQVKASHILIKSDSVKDDEAAKKTARDKLRAIQEKLKKGEDFAELAKAGSECPSAPKGGDLGYFAKGQMVKPFEDAAFAMKTGETSDIVVTQFGYHLIRVTDRKPESTVSLDEAKAKISDHLKKQKSIETVNQHIEKIRAAAKIETFL
ncbi:MAG: peptidylprolyl isomerase [Desulfococcaceae bacterium]